MAENLVSIRGLVEGGGTPLRRFKGKFAEYLTEPASGYEGTRVILNFGPDVEVLQSNEPYNLPTASINLGLSNKKRSKWGYFSDSLAQFLAPTEDIKDALDKEMGLVYTDGQDGRPSPSDTRIWNRDAGNNYKIAIALEQGIKAIMDKGAKATSDEQKKLIDLKAEREAIGEVYPDGMVPTPVWLVYELEGAVATEGGNVESANDKLLRELVGKTRAEFNKVALGLSYVKANPPLQRAIIDKSFITGMTATGKVHEDTNGVFQAGKEES